MRTSRAGIWSRPVRSGFTLLEILAVMVILALVAGVVAPSVGLVGDRGGLKSAARRLAGAVHEARTHAGRTRAWAELSISVGSKKRGGPVSLRLTGEDADGGGVDMGRVKLPDAVVLHDVLVEGAEPASTGVLRFHPRGLTLPAAVRLRVGEDMVTVCVNPVGGVAFRDGLAGLEQCRREEWERE